MTAHIIIADSNPQSAGQIETHLKHMDLSTRIISQPGELPGALADTSPEVLVVNQTTLTAEISPETIFEQVPTVVYAAEMDVETEFQWYEKGASRVVVADQALAEHVAGVVKMALYRRKNLREYRQKFLTHGDLHTLSLAELLQNAMYDRKSLVVKIHHRNCHAKIRTFRGHVISAEMSNLTGVEALIKALHLSAGSFVVQKCHIEKDVTTLPVSTPGVLAEMRFQQQEIQRLAGFFHTAGSNPRLAVVHSEKIFELPRTRLKILDMVEEFGLLNDILLHSPRSLLKTVRVLQEFADAGLIRLHDARSVAEEPAAAATTSVKEALAALLKNSGTLIILGGKGRSRLVQQLAGGQSGTVKSHQAVDLARLDLSPNVRLNILGISVEETFLPVLEKVSKSLIGCVLLVDYRDKAQHEFTGYLFNRMIQLYDTAFLIALTNIDTDEAVAVATVRQQLGMPESVPIVAMDPEQADDIIKMMAELTALPPEAASVPALPKNQEEMKNA